MVVTGNTLKKSRVAVSLSKTRPGFLYAAVGVHPHWSQKEWSDNSLKVQKHCNKEIKELLIGNSNLRKHEYACKH
jgi:Tat protein secretion system quality control protein TatD with DNase activity